MTTTDYIANQPLCTLTSTQIAQYLDLLRQQPRGLRISGLLYSRCLELKASDVCVDILCRRLQELKEVGR